MRERHSAKDRRDRERTRKAFLCGLENMCRRLDYARNARARPAIILPHTGTTISQAHSSFTHTDTHTQSHVEGERRPHSVHKHAKYLKYQITDNVFFAVLIFCVRLCARARSVTMSQTNTRHPHTHTHRNTQNKHCASA